MPKKPNHIPIVAKSENGEGIFIVKMSVEDLDSFEEVKHSHRDDYHLFLLQEKGTTNFEIDFQKHTIKPSFIFYIHPNQVHRVIAFENVAFYSLAINNESLNTENLKLLEDISPVKPLLLDEEMCAVVAEMISLCLRFFERKQEKLYHNLLKESCNSLVTLMASQYLDEAKSTNKPSRFEDITKKFKTILERNYTTVKKPTAYAGMLNISTPYLNECIKNTTGYSVSHHIQQRVILEAKRLLYHSDNSIKEIAFQLGYDDYAYFSRLFTKVAGISPLVFRNKNLD